MCYQTVRDRLEKGVPIEILFERNIESKDSDHMATDYETWKDCTPEQLETMREFEQIGNSSKF